MARRHRSRPVHESSMRKAGWRVVRVWEPAFKTRPCHRTPCRSQQVLSAFATDTAVCHGVRHVACRQIRSVRLGSVELALRSAAQINTPDPRLRAQLRHSGPIGVTDTYPASTQRGNPPFASGHNTKRYNAAGGLARFQASVTFSAEPNDELSLQPHVTEKLPTLYRLCTRISS